MTPSPPERPSGRGVGPRGSVLMLFPAAMLIVMVLAALTVDSAIAFLGQRQMADAVVAAANDAAGEGVGNQAFYQGGRVDLDASTVEQMASDRVTAALDAERFHHLAVDVAVLAPSAPGCPPRVRVHASARVPMMFAAVLPGGPHDRGVEASAVAAPAQLAQAGCG